MHPQDVFSTSPVIGFANPVAPPVEVWAVEGHEGWREVRGRVTYGYAYEGPPTCVHGGVIAELFDELLGMWNILVGSGAMTGTLTVRYRRPTPLLAPLELVARHTGKEGRKVYAWGGIYHQGELTAEADGIFIEVPPDRMLDIVSGNAHSTEAPLVVDPDWQQDDGARCGEQGRPVRADSRLTDPGPVGSSVGGSGHEAEAHAAAGGCPRSGPPAPPTARSRVRPGPPSTGSVTDGLTSAGRTWSAPCPGDPWACR